MDNNERYDLFNLVQSDDNIELVRTLLAGGVDPNFEYFRIGTLLHVAAMSSEDNVQIVQELIRLGFEVNSSCSFSSYTPLHCPVIYRKRRVVEALLRCRIDINSKDFDGETALHYAVKNILPGTVDLLRIPSDILYPDVWIVRKLLEHQGMRVNERNFSYETPLMLAVKDKHLEIVKLLLNRGSNVDAFNGFGQTPLHIALTHEDPCPYTVILLLLKRPNILKMNEKGETPLNIIIEHKLFHFSCICLKIIVFNYEGDIRERLMNLVSNDPRLFQIIIRYDAEINLMIKDIIANQLTVFDFCSNSVLQSGFSNPVLELYKPLVERIITGKYSEYFCYILHRISKSNLSEVLKCTVDEEYCKKNKIDKKNCDDNGCKKEHRTAFTEVFRLGLLSGYLETFDIFCLTVIFSSVEIDKFFLNFRHPECYLSDSWEEYPDDYFNFKS